MNTALWGKRVIQRIAKTQKSQPERIDGLFELISGNEASDFDRIFFPIVQSPEVSIIIPVYNQFSYTYNCLRSISENVSEHSYEILIADDGSTDLTQEITWICPGVRVIRTDKNSGFLLNCNHAAEAAKGKYLVFLNNDTQVRRGWLESLLEMMESDEKIGLAGSKLIYPDGRLQEAGGLSGLMGQPPIMAMDIFLQNRSLIM